MESNASDENHLDANVLLPPRKRLLAGLKKQNLDANYSHPSTSSKTILFDAQLNNSTSYHFGYPKLSLEEKVEASREAASSAFKVAVRARAVAEEKAEIAARAMAFAKRALDLVELINEDEANRERYLIKNRIKKHLIHVETLYNEKRSVGNSRTDEELARKLHRVMNSSPRIAKNTPTSAVKNNKFKKLKFNGNGFAGEGSTSEVHITRVDEDSTRLNEAELVEMDVDEEDESQLEGKKVEKLDDFCSIVREKATMKQKSLPSSICSFRDRANPEEQMKTANSLFTVESNGKFVMDNLSTSSVVPRRDGVAKTPMLNCRAFKDAVSVKENEVLQS